jgi:hypothetical protein
MMEDFRPGGSERQTPKQNVRTVEASLTPFGAGGITTVHHEPLGLAPPRRMPHHRVKDWFNGISRRAQIITLVITSIVLLGAVIGGYMIVKPKNNLLSVSGSHKRAAAGGVTTVASHLTGLQVDPGVNERPVIGVMVENSRDARPQSGLDQAGVVFEALAEGGVTRFLALYQDNQAGFIGPVRSARPYYIQWCQGFDCDYAHVGGSPDALADIKAWNIRDLNQFYGGSYFSRVGNRKAPHNVYTSIERLNAFADSKHYGGSKFTGFVRTSKAAKAKKTATAATAIDLNYHSSTYNVHYDYDTASGTYKRSVGGAAHSVVDQNGTSVQLAPKVVVALSIPLSRGALDASGAYYSNYQVVGTGECEIFQHGTMTHGTWSKPAATSQITFTDDAGAIVKLDPGQTWLSALSSIGDATYH